MRAFSLCSRSMWDSSNSGVAPVSYTHLDVYKRQEEVYDQLKGIRCPSTIRQQGMSCTSCPDAIAKVLAKVDQMCIRDST